MPLSVISMPVKGCMVMRALLRRSGRSGTERAPGTSRMSSMPKSIFRKVKPALHALLEALALRDLPSFMRVGVGVEADAVAELAAEHLVDGHAVGLAGQVPAGHLDARTRRRPAARGRRTA